MKCEWCPPKCYPPFPASFRVTPGFKDLPNPGSIEQLHWRALRIMPKFFDGVEISYNHRMSSSKCLICNWILSHTRPSGFTIGGTYAMFNRGTKLETPIIHADLNPSTFAANVGIIYYPLDMLRLEACFQSTPDCAHPFSGVIELNHRNTNVTANLYNISKNRGRSTLSILRGVTDHIALGGEIRVEWIDCQGCCNIITVPALAARYQRYGSAIAATMSREGADFSYWRRIHKSIQMAAGFAYNRSIGQAVASLGYQWDFEKATIKGKLDSDLSVGFSYCRTLEHIPCILGMSLLFCIPTNRFIFGIKMDLDPSGLRRDCDMYVRKEPAA